MARNREKNRDKVKAVKREERLDSKTAWGISDPTPRQAVDSLISHQRYVEQYKWTSPDIAIEGLV